jgi:hypothetical protein
MNTSVLGAEMAIEVVRIIKASRVGQNAIRASFL